MQNHWQKHKVFSSWYKSTKSLTCFLEKDQNGFHPTCSIQLFLPVFRFPSSHTSMYANTLSSRREKCGSALVEVFQVLDDRQGLKQTEVQESIQR